MTFGGSPGPFEWGIILETFCNLTTTIRQNDDWEPMKIFGRNQHLVPPPKFLEDLIPFVEGLELVVDILINSRGMLDIYIDNLVSLAVEIEGTDNLIRSDCAPLLAFNTCACLLDPNEPIPRKTMTARDKLAAEAMLEEQKMILGWFLDFCCLWITLPDNKFKAWISAIEKIIQEGSAMAKEIEQNIGRLVHLGLALPFIHHFMSRLRDLHLTAT